MMQNYLIEGFALGLSTGLTCIVSCGPIYSTFLMQHKNDVWQSFIMLLKISAGRFISYLLFGMIAGALGHQIGNINRPWFTAIAYILFSSMLILSALRTHRKDKGCAIKKWSRFAENPYLLGLVTGINFCPSFLIALTRAVDLSGPLSGGLLFAAFFFGTNIYLFPLLIFGVMGNKIVFRRIAVASSILVGVWFIGLAGRTVYDNVSSVKNNINPDDIVSLLDNTPAYILCQDTTQYYILRDALRQKRDGSVLLSADTTNIPDSCNLFVEHDWRGTTESFATLRRPGRFVIVLPQPDQKNLYDLEYANRIIKFLSGFQFKINHKEGTFFSMVHQVSEGRK